MRPLVSGPEAKRYEECATDTYLLFPYETDKRGAVALIDAETMAVRYPLAMQHLTNFEVKLRERETSSFDDHQWYRFGRNQNLDKQELSKLIVAQTVPQMRVCADFDGSKYLNNVRVNGILNAPGCDVAFLLGVLNGAVADFVFRRTAKPKQGGWFEANKQFIAPLPVPHANESEQHEIGGRARALQVSWTRRRDLLLEAEARLSVLGRARHGARWLWPDLPDMTALKDQAPRALRAHEKTEWAHGRLSELEEAQLAALQGVLDGGTPLSARFSDGELRLYAGGEVVLGKIYLDPPEGALAEAYWRFLLLRREARDAKSLASSLRRVPAGPETPAARQFIERVAALVDETQALRVAERGMNERLYELYRLSPEERLLVEKDCAARAVI